MCARIFIDGQEGTTGLSIHTQLKDRDDLELLEIDSSHRKHVATKASLYSEADIVVLCLPDDAAREAVALDADTRFLDASTAHRVDPQWVYGMPELCGPQRNSIRNAKKVANPGCYPTGVLLLTRPLTDAGIIDPDATLKVHAVSGYSGGGKKLIQKYEQSTNKRLDPRPYALQLEHKHLPEMQKYAGLNNQPLFAPIVGPYHSGMLVHIALAREDLLRSTSVAELSECYRVRYLTERFVRTHKPAPTDLLDEGFLSATDCNATNYIDLMVFGNEEQFLLVARLDNLGKGASLAAIQNINLMLGRDETTGIPL